MQVMRQRSKLPIVGFIGLVVSIAGCGGATYAPPTTPVTANSAITGPFDVVLTSTNGHGTTNIYTDFTQTGETFTGAPSTLVCPSNELSQCEGDDAPAISIIPSGKVNGANVTLVIAFPTSAGADTVTMSGSAAGTGFAGTYTDSLGDSGNWTASGAMHPFGPPPGVYDYSGTFNSTSNPLLIAPTISLELGKDASSVLRGTATITNSPCISSLTLKGDPIGDAFSLTDATNKVSIMAIPAPATSNKFNFSYKFEATAANCAGDVGRGVVTIAPSPFDY